MAAEVRMPPNPFPSGWYDERAGEWVQLPADIDGLGAYCVRMQSLLRALAAGHCPADLPRVARIALEVPA